MYSHGHIKTEKNQDPASQPFGCVILLNPRTQVGSMLYHQFPKCSFQNGTFTRSSHVKSLPWSKTACWGSLPGDCGGVFTSATRWKLICPCFWGPYIYRIRASMGESYLVWLGTKSSLCGQESSNYGVSECKESPDFVDLLRQHSLMALGHSVEHSSQSAPFVGWQDDNKGIKEDQLQVIFLAKFRSPTAYKHEN